MTVNEMALILEITPESVNNRLKEKGLYKGVNGKTTHYPFDYYMQIKERERKPRETIKEVSLNAKIVSFWLRNKNNTCQSSCLASHKKVRSKKSTSLILLFYQKNDNPQSDL